MDRVDYESVVIQDLLNFYEREELNIRPWYQRRSVWTAPQKSYLVNTIHERKPIPSVYIRHTIDLDREMSIKEVVDGQQRISCLIDYRNDEFASPHPDHKRPVKYSELTSAQKKKFLLTSLSVGYLIGAEDADVIEIFARINSVAKTLNPQEKRNAQFSGEYKRFCLGQAVERLSFWRDYSVFSDGEIARMAEVQFVSDLVMNLAEGLQDFSATKLTKYYQANDEQFDLAEEVAQRLDFIFTQILALPVDELKGSIFCVPQVLLTLMFAIDRAGKIDRKKLERCIVEIDSRVEAVRTGENERALTTRQYEAFSSGNLHRIKQRKARLEVIESYL